MNSDDPFPKPDISPAQIRAARALLDWTVVEASGKMGIGKNTLNRIETGQSVPSDRTLRDIVTIFEKAGVRFFNSDRERGAALETRS